MGPDYRDAFRVQTASLYNLEIQIQVQVHDMMGPDYSSQSECIGEECITYDLKIPIQIQIQILHMMGPYYSWRPLANVFRLRYLQLGNTNTNTHT